MVLTIPEGYDPKATRERLGLTDIDMAFFRQDKEIISFIHKFTGYDIPMAVVEDELLITIAGMVEKLGVDGAVELASKMNDYRGVIPGAKPHSIKAIFRKVALDQKSKKLPRNI